eukprot:CAMPEP_0194167278 /NCGR_PEP_ID=MMETSP0154-20130528/2606_1 /TAXON_ID=1049557 /ORGANISM="Thalassiothrix antarctica, Strain L6-D1" /LENGTH=576 /DNA_ID=CAMNT_0038878139 /DNA_START=268 /DNA_END=1995 /DNA_ORIENTATION=+
MRRMQSLLFLLLLASKGNGLLSSFIRSRTIQITSSPSISSRNYGGIIERRTQQQFFASITPAEQDQEEESTTTTNNSNNDEQLEIDDRGRIIQGPQQQQEGPNQEQVKSATVVAAENSPTKRVRFMNSLPRFLLFGRKSDDLDNRIINTCVPNMINLGVVPIVNSVDTFWVGRLGSALALAGQSAANQASFTVFFLIAFLPTIIAPLVASSVANGETEEAQRRVCESLFLCSALGLVGTVALTVFPRQVLSWLVLPSDAPAMDYAAPYLRWRALSMVPSLMSATGFAAYRGLLNTVTPLKVSLGTNALNLVLDPLCIFAGGMGFVGAAVATAVSELVGGLTYLKLLLRRKLVRWSLLFRPPSLESLLPLLQGGAAMLLRQLAINVGFLVATRRAQLMDPTGVAGAAYGITMQMYSVGIILLVAMQSTAATLVPSTMAAVAAKKKKNDNDEQESSNNKETRSYSSDDAMSEARAVGDRLLGWSSLVGLVVGGLNYALLPVLVPVFSTLPEVQKAVYAPSLIASLLHIMNGPVLAGEGILMGLGCYRGLAFVTTAWIAAMVGLLSTSMAQKRIDGIMW